MVLKFVYLFGPSDIGYEYMNTEKEFESIETSHVIISTPEVFLVFELIVK